MSIWNFLTADRKINPILVRQYFSRQRFAREDARVMRLPLAPLPAVQGEPPAGGEGPVLFAVADFGYFKRFANMFASSAAVSSPQSAVHLHVVGADAAPHIHIDRLPKHFSVTFEPADFSHMNISLKGRYCQCLRFLRLAQFVKATGRSYVAFDIDGLFQKSFANFATDFNGDVGLIVRPEYSDPGLRVNAGVVFMRATALAEIFMDEATQRMALHVQHAPFIEKLDQRCLAMALQKHETAVAALDGCIYGFEPGQGWFYSAKGPRKNEILQQVFQDLVLAK